MLWKKLNQYNNIDVIIFFQPHFFDTVQVGNLNDAKRCALQFIRVNGNSVDLDPVRINPKTNYGDIDPKQE